MLEPHHVFNTDSHSLYRGDGQKRTRVRFVRQTVDTFAGGGTTLTDQEGGPATNAYLANIEDLAQAADGSIYVAMSGYGGRIRRVSQDGIITTVVGLAPTVPKVDGAPALHAAVSPTGLAFGPDGTLYFAERTSGQVWAVVPGSPPVLRHVAGNGNLFPGSVDCIAPAQPNCGDGGDARLADLRSPVGVAVGPDGTVFVHDANVYRGVRRIGPEGIITTYLHTRSLFGVGTVDAITLRSDGALMVLRKTPDRLDRIEPNGEIHPVPVGANLWGTWCRDSSVPTRRQVVGVSP